MENDFSAQSNRAGLVMMSDVTVEQEYVCVPCVKSGKTTFLCHLCKERKPTNKIQDSFGQQASFLCTDCYETVVAKEWKRAEKELLERHRYDF
jgi:hypothetical protein